VLNEGDSLLPDPVFTDLAEKIEPFIECFRAGNFPMGRFADRSFLVLVQ